MTRRETSATTASRGVSCHAKQFVPSPRDIHQPCRKQRPFQQGPGCLIWEEGMEHRAVHNWGILVLKPPPPSLPRPIPRSGTTSTTLFPPASVSSLWLCQRTHSQRVCRSRRGSRCLCLLCLGHSTCPAHGDEVPPGDGNVVPALGRHGDSATRERNGEKIAAHHGSNYNIDTQKCKPLPARLSSSKCDAEAETFSEAALHLNLWNLRLPSCFHWAPFALTHLSKGQSVQICGQL